MKIRFVNIVLLVILFFSWEASQASSPSSENEKKFIEHSKLSCLDCHSLVKENPDHPSYEDSNTSCLECHDDFSEFPHNMEYTVDCLNCHSRHHEKISHDSHSGVPCKVCHLYDIKPDKKINNGIAIWGYEPDTGGEYNPHRLTMGKENICSMCHHKGNILGASDHALPAKSIICMPCHAATFSIGDIPSATAIIIFLTGAISIVFIWLSAGRSHIKIKALNFIYFISVIEVLILDVFFQRRLLKISVKRWTIHEIIFLPFVIRFIWGLTALLLSLFHPEWNITWVMLDKNNPVTGLLFDITGLMILMGGLLKIIEKRTDKKLRSIKELPKSNALFNVLLGAMIITGFVVEGARITMTGSPEGSQFAFIGYGISRIISDYHLNGLYAYLWYIHAIITAAFIACLPFSRMFHIFTAPLSLFLSGASRD